MFSFVIRLKKWQSSKIVVNFDKLSLLNRLSYRPGIGLEWKKIRKSLKSSQEKTVKNNIFFLICLKTNKEVQFFLFPSQSILKFFTTPSST